MMTSSTNDALHGTDSTPVRRVRQQTWRAPAHNATARPHACRTAAATIVATIAILVSATSATTAQAQTTHHARYDYPTAARADYVIGCMAANGFHHELLDRCACGIDTIADLLSYEDYEQASTILSMQQAGVGPRGGLFKDTPVARDETAKLRRAQAEVNLRCG